MPVSSSPAWSNATAGAFSVAPSANLVDWDYLSSATSLYQCFNTNARCALLDAQAYRCRHCHA